MVRKAQVLSRASARPEWLRHCWLWLQPLRRTQPDAYREIRRRVAVNWQTLERKVWAPLAKNMAHEAINYPSLLKTWGDPDSVGGLCAMVLEGAVWWGHESASKAAAVRSAADRLSAIELQLADLMQTAVNLLEERDRLHNQGLHRRFPAIVDDLEDLLELVGDRFPRWRCVVDWKLQPFLAISRSTSQPGPRLADVLDFASLRGAAVPTPAQPVYANEADDNEVLRPQQGSDSSLPAARTRQFLAVLAEKCTATVDRNLEPIGALQWIGPTGLAHLLSVVERGCPAHDGVHAGATKKGEPFNVKAVEKERREFLKRWRDDLSSDDFDISSLHR